MQIEMLKSKIHRAKVTEACLDYEGSITIDYALMRKANIHEFEKVTVVNINNGNRFDTYVIKGEENSGIICLNGACARLCHINDLVIIMCYCALDNEEAKNHKPIVVHVDSDNNYV